MSSAGAAASGAALLERVVRRSPLEGHDGRSGARLERVELDDGARLVVKRTSPAVDLVMRLTGATASREHVLWRAGILDRLPAGVDHAMVAAWVDGDETVLVLRDLGETVVGWTRVLSRDAWRRVLGALTRLHRAFGDGPGPPVDGLCPLVDRVSLFAPWRMAPAAADGHPLPSLVLRGWERFAGLAPAEVVDATFAVLAAPERLSRPLAGRSSTLIHGDPWLVNVALEQDDQVTFLDWDLATWAPPALDFALFLDGNSSRVAASLDELVDDLRTAWGDDHDEVALRLALFAGLAELGWNKALDVAEHPDPDVRAREGADLGWWVAQARRTLELGLV